MDVVPDNAKYQTLTFKVGHQHFRILPNSPINPPPTSLTKDPAQNQSSAYTDKDKMKTSDLPWDSDTDSDTRVRRTLPRTLDNKSTS